MNPLDPKDSFLQPKITGYRQLTKEEAELMNEGKALAMQCGAYIEKLRSFSAARFEDKPLDGLVIDQRWVSIGATHLQQGFMATTRSIARPETF